MKKVLIIAALAITTSLTSFGQGYFLFTANAGTVYDSFTTPGAGALAADMDVAFLWAASGTPTVDALEASTPKNSTASFSLATAWNDILNDPNFTLAVNNSTTTTAISPTAINGGVSYNTGHSFAVTGTAASTYEVFLIAWSSTYATPEAAALADAAVGWSSVFDYTAVNSIGTPGSMHTAGLSPFGVVTAVPEPTSMALAGLSGAALLFFRRKKA